MNVWDDFYTLRKTTIEFRGKLLRLFGDPPQSSKFAEEAFDYVIEVTDENGEILILTAYDGPSGPAIGALSEHFGGDKEANLRAAKELLELLENTEPADYEAAVYDDDTDNTVWYGIQDGEIYYREEPGKHIDL